MAAGRVGGSKAGGSSSAPRDVAGATPSSDTPTSGGDSKKVLADLAGKLFDKYKGGGPSQDKKIADEKLETAKIEKAAAETELEAEKVELEAEREKKWHESARESISDVHKKVKENPHWIKWGILFAIAIASDAADLLGGFIPYFGDIVDVLTLAILIPFVGHKKQLLWGLPEFLSLFPPLAFIELFPWWTLAVFLAMRAETTGDENDAQPKKTKKPRFQGMEGLSLDGLGTRFTWSQIIVALIILFIVIAGLFLGFRQGGDRIMSQFDTDFGYGYKIIMFPITAIQNIVAWFQNHNPVTMMDTFMQRRIAYATGDYFVGTVDENAQERLGVFLKDIEPSSTYFYQDEAVIVWATLEARTLDQKKGIDITTSCAVDMGEKDEKMGATSPEQLNNVEAFEQKDLDCRFERGMFESGSEVVQLSALFDFQTMAYLNSYYIDEKRLRSMRREEIDPFTTYGISERDPTAVFTTGPVRIGMDTTEALVPVVEGDTKFRIGFTIENNWEGKIKNLTYLTLKVPPDMKLVAEECDKNVIEDDCKIEGDKDECENGRYTKVYRLGAKTDEMGRKGMDSVRDLTSFETFKCRVTIPEGKREAVLGNTPVAKHYFKVDVGYNYELTESLTVNIRRPTGFSAYITPSQPMLSQDFKCIGMNYDDPAKEARFSFFKAEGESKTELSALAPIPCQGENGECVGTISSRKLRGLDLKKGDKVGCEMLATSDVPIDESIIGKWRDGVTVDRTYHDTDYVIIKNSPPTIIGKVEQSPKNPKAGDEITLTVSLDDADVGDRDKVYLFYEVPVFDQQEKIKCDPLEGRNVCKVKLDKTKITEEIDNVMVTLTPSDGENGKPTKYRVEIYDEEEAGAAGGGLAPAGGTGPDLTNVPGFTYTPRLGQLTLRRGSSYGFSVEIANATNITNINWGLWDKEQNLIDYNHEKNKQYSYTFKDEGNFSLKVNIFTGPNQKLSGKIWQIKVE